MNNIIPELSSFDAWLPLAFLGFMGIAMLAYVILDGFDLGVGILLSKATPEEKDTMIASIGPFWDANETWLVLGVGILLVAFPAAHGIILGHLYLPVTFMLIFLVLRGVSFDFRVKAGAKYKESWDTAFYLGSIGATLCQGYMLGLLVTGFQANSLLQIYALLIGCCLVAGYRLLGACWLIIRCTGTLQLKAIEWAQRALLLTAAGVLLISIATPLLSERIFIKWFSLPYFVLLLPIPITTILLFFIIKRSLKRIPIRLKDNNEYGIWVPFASTIGIFCLAFYGLAYSLFPYLVIDELTIWQAAASTESLWIIFIGTVIVLPIIIAYSAFSYWIFRGKTTPLEYG